jgi:hypothetical protein
MAFPSSEWAAASMELLELQYFASRSFDLTERNVIMNKPDEKETGNEGTHGCHRP